MFRTDGSRKAASLVFFSVVAGGLGTLFLSAPATAGETGDRRVNLVLTSVTEPVYYIGAGDQLSLKDKKGATVSITSGRNIEFWVMDYNPVLYTYASKLETEKSEDAKAIESFLSELKKFGTPTTTGTAPARDLDQVCPLQLSGIDLDQLKRRFERLQKVVGEDIPGYVLTLANAGRGDLKKKAADDATALQETLGVGGAHVDIDALDAAIKKLNDLDLVPLGDGLALRDCHGVIASADSFDALIRGRERAIPAGDVDKEKQIRDEVAKIDLASMMARRAADLRAGIAQVKKFSSTLFKVGQDFKISDESLEADQKGTYTITVKVNSEFETFIAGAKKIADSHADSYKVAINTYQHWHPEISIAAVYSFVKNPQYSIESNSGGQLAVAQKSNDYNKLSGAITLNLTPDAWNSDLVRPHIQMGLVPDSDKLAFFTGFGITAANYFDLNFGAVYQKRTVLGSGLSVGQAVSSTQSLKTSTEFKTGFYVGVGIKVKERSGGK